MFMSLFDVHIHHLFCIVLHITQSYLDALSSGAAEAPAAPAVKELINTASSGGGIASYLSSLPVTNARAGGAGMSSYLATVPSNPTQFSGAGISSYLNTVPSNPVRMAGTGMSSYLDSVNQACDAAQPDTSGCAEAISEYVGALSTGAAP